MNPKIFFSDKMWAENKDAFSPSSGKPKKVMEAWRDKWGFLTVIEPNPMSIEDLSQAHNGDYVVGVLNCELPNGFGNKCPEVAASLPYTSGAMFDAALAALQDGVAVAPVSGFHHAGYSHGGGFCTFNGLMATAINLHKGGHVNHVGILDFDMHYGNGTNEIIGYLEIDYVSHHTQGACLSSIEYAEQFLKDIPGIIQKMKDEGCEIVLYQAGADPNINDPLGGWLTTKQMKARDRIVFETCRKLKLPVAWNLAGGYQKPIEKVIEIHANTLSVCIKAFEGA